MYFSAEKHSNFLFKIISTPTLKFSFLSCCFKGAAERDFTFGPLILSGMVSY